MEGFPAQFHQKLAEKRAREDEVIKAEYKPPPEIDMEALMTKFEEFALQQVGMETCRIPFKEVDGLEEWKRHKISRSSTGIYVALLEKQGEDYQKIIDSIVNAWNTRNPGFLMTWHNGTFLIALPRK